MPERHSLTFEDILQPHPPEIQELAESLRDLVHAALPEASERVYPGWRALGFRDHTAGYLCGIFPFEDRIQIAFEQGAHLPDPEGMLEARDLKQVRYMTLRPGDAIPRRELQSLLVAALHYGTVHAATRRSARRTRKR